MLPLQHPSRSGLSPSGPSAEGGQGVGQPAPVHEVGADRVAPVRGPGQPRVPVRAVPLVVLERTRDTRRSRRTSADRRCTRTRAGSERRFGRRSRPRARIVPWLPPVRQTPRVRPHGTGRRRINMSCGQTDLDPEHTWGHTIAFCDQYFQRAGELLRTTLDEVPTWTAVRRPRGADDPRRQHRARQHHHRSHADHGAVERPRGQPGAVRVPGSRPPHARAVRTDARRRPVSDQLRDPGGAGGARPRGARHRLHHRLRELGRRAGLARRQPRRADAGGCGGIR